jgi:hypothetical protein
MCNIANEYIIHPKALRMGLIRYLNAKGIQFQWSTTVNNQMLHSEPNTYWVVAAGIGSEALTKNTELEQVPFADSGLVDVIYCALEKPFNLHGAVFHFAASDITPGFRVRNDESDPYKLKILVEFPVGKNNNLGQAAQNILKILGVTTKELRCDSSIGRPQTKDGRPVIEIGKISTVYGHGLFSSAVLFDDFASNLTNLIYQQQQDVDLSSFSSRGRFAKL